MLRTMFHRGLLLTCLAACVTSLMAQSPCGATAQLNSAVSPLSGQDGIFFDLVASNTVTIKCFQTYFTSNAQDRTNIYIWYRYGSHIGRETDPTQWTLIDSIMSFTIPSNQATLWHIPIPINLPMSVGDTLAFYITNGDVAGMNNTGIRYDSGNGTAGVLQASDANLSIFEGAGAYNRWIIYAGSRRYSGLVNYSTASTAGIDEVLDLSPAACSPNPVVDELTIASEAMQDVTEVAILDALGRTLRMERIINGGPTRLNVSALTSGTYIARLSGTGVHRTFRFVKE